MALLLTIIIMTNRAEQIAVTFADIYEAANNVHRGLGAKTEAGFSEACFQMALAAELTESQREVVREVPYYCKSLKKRVTVGHVRFDLVYRNFILEIKCYRTKCKTSPPQTLHAQLAGYKLLLRPGEVLVAVLFWKNGVDVFEYK